MSEWITPELEGCIPLEELERLSELVIVANSEVRMTLDAWTQDLQKRRHIHHLQWRDEETRAILRDLKHWLNRMELGE